MPEEIKPTTSEDMFVPSDVNRLEEIDGLIETVSTAPTHVPRVFSEQFRIYKNGSTERFYWFDVVNNEWNYTALTTLAAEGESALSGAVTLSEGANITLTQTGNDIEIAASFTDTDSTIVEFTAVEAITEDDAVCVYGGNTHSIDLELGSSQYLVTGDTAALSITGNMTLEMNIRLETAITGIAMGLIQKSNETGDQRSYILQYRDEGGTPTVRLQTSANGIATSTTDWAYTFSTSTWYHIAVVYSTTGPTATLYVNGATQGTGTGTPAASLKDSSADVVIGATYATSYNNFFDGLIDDVRIWNTDRSSTQIDNNKALEVAGDSTNLQAYWRLNNNLLDWTANGQTLTNPVSASFSTTTPFTGTAGVMKTSAANTVRGNSFIGFANETIASGVAGDIKINGVKTGLTGLTPGSTYYLSDTAGAIATSAGTNSRKVGLATTTTTLLIKHDNV